MSKQLKTITIRYQEPNDITIIDSGSNKKKTEYIKNNILPNLTTKEIIVFNDVENKGYGGTNIKQTSSIDEFKKMLSYKRNNDSIVIIDALEPWIVVNEILDLKQDEQKFYIVFKKSKY